MPKTSAQIIGPENSMVALPTVLTGSEMGVLAVLDKYGSSKLETFEHETMLPEDVLTRALQRLMDRGLVSRVGDTYLPP